MTVNISGRNGDRLGSVEWIQSFKERHGRPPRILHIGNIANNAYLNAKILHKAGLDCDVICYDYYHIMGCPEWEDADFDGPFGDQFYPNWRSVNLNGFKRPAWFAQGPLHLCIDYLISRRDGKKLKTHLYWRLLEVARYFRCLKITVSARRFLRAVWYGLCSFLTVVHSHHSALYGSSFPLGRLVYYCTLFVCIPFLIVSYLFLTIIVLPTKVIRRVFFHVGHVEAKEYPFQDRIEKLIEDFAEKFPDREDKLTESDLLDYKLVMGLWRKLFSKYDIIQAYSTDVVLPMLANNRPYVGFEHGTLREIPFQCTPQGRRTALGYNLAKHVLVTNADCLANAHILANGRVSLINHPYDEDREEEIKGAPELRVQLFQRLDSDFLFFFPTRHDWVPDSGYADKGNDIFLNAFCTLRDEGYKVGAICCTWGANVRESQDLLKRRGCAPYVYWSDTMGRIRFERSVKASDVVVDQFKLGSFGGVMFKAMAVGAPVCTYLEETVIVGRYPEIPPVINCRTEDDIVTEMRKMIENPSMLRDLSRVSRDWIRKYHSSTETVGIQLSIYRDCVQEKPLYQATI